MARRSDPPPEKRSAAVRETRTPPPAALPTGEKPTRKNHYLYQSKIDLAKEILGVRTETEALDHALDALIYGEALARGTEAMAGEEYHDLLGLGREVPDSEDER